MFGHPDSRKFLQGHHTTLGMGQLVHCGDNAAAEGLFGMLKRERVNRCRYLPVDDARAEILDHIEGETTPASSAGSMPSPAGVSILTQPSTRSG